MGYCEHYFVVENFSLPSKAAHISVDGNQIVVGQPEVYAYLNTGDVKAKLTANDNPIWT